MNQLGAAGRPRSGSFLRPDPDEEVAALDRARSRDGPLPTT
jgi:ubiquinol-cytochrome c reductase cytochrome b subunit